MGASRTIRLVAEPLREYGVSMEMTSTSARETA
jgi:hypothetical protein